MIDTVKIWYELTSYGYEGKNPLNHGNGSFYSDSDSVEFLCYREESDLPGRILNGKYSYDLENDSIIYMKTTAVAFYEYRLKRGY